MTDLAGYSPDTFANALTLANIALDPKTLATNMKVLEAKIAEFKKAEAAAGQAEASLATARAAQEAELAEHWQRLAAEKEALSIRKAEVEKRYETIDEARAEVDSERRRLNGRMKAFAGLVQHPLQSEPTDAQIDAEVFGRRSDVHYDDDSAMAVTEAVPMAAGGTLTRTKHRSMRRVEGA